MKGLVLAGAACLFLFVTTVVGLRVYRGAKEYRVFLGAFAAAIALFVALHRMLPDDLGLPGLASEPSVGVDFWNGLLILAMVFHGFWVFSYVACVGPSARIALALRDRNGRALGFEQILALFASTDDQDMILSRRLPKLTAGRYIAAREDGFVALARGRRYGRIALLLKQALGSGLGG